MTLSRLPGPGAWQEAEGGGIGTDKLCEAF